MSTLLLFAFWCQPNKIAFTDRTVVSEHFSCHHWGNFFPKIRAIHCNCITCEQAIVFLSCTCAILLTVCGFFYVHKGGRGGGGVDDDKTNHTFQWRGQLILGRCWAQGVCGFIIKISQMKNIELSCKRTIWNTESSSQQSRYWSLQDLDF